ncbi:uncharacterized protein KZ484_010880 [Pholidichthys leucotaenia]
MVTPTDEDNDKSETEANSEQLLSHNSADTESQDQGSDSPQLHDCKEEEVLTVQQLWNQERNSSLDQEEQDAAQVKEEDELCSSQEEEDFELKQETDSSMVTPTDEDNDKSETEANSEQLLSHNSADAESQDQGADKCLFSTGPTGGFSALLYCLRRRRELSWSSVTMILDTGGVNVLQVRGRMLDREEDVETEEGFRMSTEGEAGDTFKVHQDQDPQGVKDRKIGEHD